MLERTVVLMDRYGWTFDEVCAQPAAVLFELELYRSIRSQVESQRR